MGDTVDWVRIAESIGVSEGSTSSDDAKRAIEVIIGKDKLSAMVDHYVHGRPYNGLVGMVLQYLNPQSAMERCYEIYKTSDDSGERGWAIQLLGDIADRRGIKWVREFLNDSDEYIRSAGAHMLEKLLVGGHADPDDEVVQSLLVCCKEHEDEFVRRIYEDITQYLESIDGGE